MDKIAPFDVEQPERNHFTTMTAGQETFFERSRFEVQNRVLQISLSNKPNKINVLTDV
jgi:hypothetical protein